MERFVNYFEAPVPAATRSYMPVPHNELITITDKLIKDAGFERGSLDVSQSHNGNRIMGTMGIVRPDSYEFSQMLVFLNSYDKSKAVTFASGAEVYVCSNGMVISEMLTMRKHTTNVWRDLETTANKAIGQLEVNWQKTQADVKLMREVELNRTQASELLGRLFVDESIITSTEINEAVRQLNKPRFYEFAEQTLWSLYNHCTFAMKEAQPHNAANRLKALHDFSVNYAADHVKVYG